MLIFPYFRAFRKLNLLEERIWLIRIEELVGVHDGDEVLSVGEVDVVVGVARQHVDGLDVVATDFELYHLIGAKLALLNQTMSRHYDEELPLGVVPVLTLRDARFRDIDAHLTAVQRMHQFREASAVIHVHLQREGHLLLRQITQER